MSEHTPGPWECIPKINASENHKGFFVRAKKVTNDGKWSLAEVHPGDEDGKLGEANARLIAAAPELLKACQLMMLSWKDIPYPRMNSDEENSLWSARNAIQSAIAKATGEEPPHAP